MSPKLIGPGFFSDNLLIKAAKRTPSCNASKMSFLSIGSLSETSATP